MFRAELLLPNALSDYTIEMSGGEQVKKIKVNHPKALCFGYQQLKDMLWFDLEMEMKRIKGHKNL